MVRQAHHDNRKLKTKKMKVCKNILETIGKTPMVKINKITKDLPCDVYAKVETFNPGNSIKDRLAIKMIEDAEKDGRLKPGGTIIEGTSGNTGMGLAIGAVIKGYKCIFTTTDKQSKEKVDALRAFGADVIVCPTDVEPEDPKSYYSVSSRFVREVPNSWKPNQYDNLSNSKAHYEQTGPEIWEQTEGKITHLVVATGTGGTIVGTGKYLKEKNPSIKVWAIDTYGSLLKKYFDMLENKDYEEAKLFLKGGGTRANYKSKYFGKVRLNTFFKNTKNIIGHLEIFILMYQLLHQARMKLLKY
jgi:cystathionine beta-synthase